MDCQLFIGFYQYARITERINADPLDQMPLTDCLKAKLQISFVPKMEANKIFAQL